MLSFDQIRTMVMSAIKAKEGPDFYCYDVALFTDAIVYESTGKDKIEKHYKRSYSIVDGVVTLGEATAVQKKVDYIPMQAASQLLAAIGAPTDENFGYEWNVQVVQYGPGADGRINWPQAPLVAAIALYNGAKVFALNDTQHVGAKDRPMGKSVREIVGWLKDPVDTGTGINATLCILHSAKWLRDNLIDSHDRGCPDLLGLSHDVTATAKTVMVAGKKMKEPTIIHGVEVDVVYSPTNNGKFIRMSAATAEESEDPLKREHLLAALAKVKPGLDTANLTDDQLLGALTAAAIEGAGGSSTDEKLVAAVVDGLKKILIVGDNPELVEMRQLVAAQRIDTALTASKLPAPCLADLRARFAGQCLTDEQLQAAIKNEKEKVDLLTGSGGVHGVGDVRIHREGGEKLQAAVDGLLGVKLADNMRDVPVFTSLRAAYAEITGDSEVRGYLDPAQSQRMQAAFGSATFAYVLGNTLYRRLSQDYREISDYGVSRLVGGNIRNAKDFRPLETVKIGYFGDLPDVNPEVDDYQDLGTLTDEQIEHVIGQKGGIITITRRMIINDDMRAVQKIINRLPRAARRGLARHCWTPFISNSTYKGDNKAIFHADHGNLGSAAYSIPAALAAKTAFSRQTELGSGERLGLRPMCVCFPSELFGLVKNVNDFNPQAVAVENGNSMYGFFKPENLHENIFMEDANDWMFLGDPNECEIMELAFLNGQQEPEMFVADQPTNGQMFVGDRIQYKIRHEYHGEVTEVRNVYKGVVAP